MHLGNRHPKCIESMYRGWSSFLAVLALAGLASQGCGYPDVEVGLCHRSEQYDQYLLRRLDSDDHGDRVSALSVIVGKRLGSALFAGMLPELTKYVQELEAEDRWAVVYRVNSRYPAGVALLVRLLRWEGESSVRAAICRGLSQARDNKTVIPVLIERLRESNQIREGAAESLRYLVVLDDHPSRDGDQSLYGAWRTWWDSSTGGQQCCLEVTP